MNHRFISLAFILLGLCRPALAQAPDSLGDVVLSYDLYSVLGDHRDTFYHRWLRPDGTFVTIATDVVRSVDLGPVVSVAGNWTYIKDTPTTAHLAFTVPADGGASSTIVLTFFTVTSGTTVNAFGAAEGYGKFSLRPSQFGVGPVNLSTRTMLTPGGSTIAGFVITGVDRRFVLLRAVGPGLATVFSLPNTATKMSVTAYDANGALGTATDWSGSPLSSSLTIAMYQNLFAMTGAFPLTPGQGDACLLLELPPGAYTAQMTSATAGNALIEVYFLP